MLGYFVAISHDWATHWRRARNVSFLLSFANSFATDLDASTCSTVVYGTPPYCPKAIGTYVDLGTSSGWTNVYALKA